ncbi:nuclear pore complex protein Nup205-like [Littorina saxatilis]|uniref:Nuclear pore complex protein Nup205 n=1 Tax=Littorina saxatilis TaxID=31220 RepID=A0AAN9BJU3_9CAEN
MADTGGMAVNLVSGARLWAPFRALQDVVNAAIYRHEPGSIHDLELSLRKHKPDFISLLKTPPKNPMARQMVTKATTEGLQVQGMQTKQKFTQQFVSEALILSDLFEMDELAAVELLMAGENQLSNYPGLTRGLVAVILFYDGQRSVVCSLRTLLQAREGHTWTLGVSPELVHLVTQFTAQLLEDKLVHKILDLIQNMDVSKELDKLQKQRALGASRHRKQVSDLFKEIRQTLAECLFCLACQQPLNKADTQRLLAHLRSDNGLGADEGLDSVSLSLLMTLLACFDISPLEQEQVETDDLVPIATDGSYLTDIHNIVKNDPRWTTSGLQSVARFAWGLTLRKLSQCQNFNGGGDLLEDDEQLVDQAIDSDLFEFLVNSVISAHDFHNEEFYVRRMHGLVTDFILQMPLKVKELRNRGDETARIILAHQIEGYEPPPQRKDFQYMLELIGDLYRKDPLKLDLAMEYWCPLDPVAASESMYAYRPPPRQVALFKFVRLAGDLLPAPLFVPYVRMLQGLASSQQCAQHAFNLLKMNGVSSGGSASTVSWDHFFESLQHYYTGMRRETPGARDMSGAPFRQPPMRTITPQELEGLCSLLELSRTVAEHNEICRGALCENQQWSVVVTLFGLLGCSVPVKLKGELLLTLAAVSKTPMIAATVWQTLEASQILPTISSQQTGGIQVELEEIESRNEEYPMTRGFLKLLNVLTDIPIPPGLGSGLRAPGFDPYLEFLIHGVLLKLNTRAYKEAGEKWQVVTGVLEVVYKLLRDHEVTEDDFREDFVELPNGSMVGASKAPGFSLLVHMLNDSSLFKMVMRILDDGIAKFESYTTFPGRSGLERATLLCLQMLVAAAEKQQDVENIIRQTSSSLMITSMERLLLSINPKTRRPDYLVTVAKFVIFNSTLSHHALAAVKILFVVSQLAPIQSDLINLFTADAKTSKELLHGFVESLESDYPEETEEAVPDVIQSEDTWSLGQVQNATRQHIVRLLLQCVQAPPPNLAHWLLGFQIQKSISKTILQDPGVMGQSRTCLHAVLNILQQGVDSGAGPRCLHDTPRLAELAYQLIYKLCAIRDTSAPTLRYLRTTYDFLFQQLRHLPFEEADYRSSVVPHQSWLLKTVAIELRLTSLNRQRSHCQRLIRLLLGDDDDEQTQVLRPVGLEDAETLGWDAEQSRRTSAALGGKQLRSKLLSLLDTVTFAYQYPSELQLKFFNPKVITNVLSSHEVTDPEGVTYYDVRALRRLLIAELDSQQGPMMAGQRPLILEEIHRLLENVVERNNTREGLQRQRQNFEAWRQVTEILLTACPEDLLSGERRQTVIFELLQELLCKVAEEEALPESTAPVSGVVLTLMANLRQCFITDRIPLDEKKQPQSNTYISLLDRSAMLSGVPSLPSPWSQGASSKTMFLTSLQMVLKGLIEYILGSRSGLQRVRVNLYGALLFYLQIAQKPAAVEETESQGVERILSGKDTEYEQLCKENLSSISAFGESFMEVVCRDACDGHDIGRMLALSVLDAIMAEDRHQQWLSYLVSKGYLQHLVDSLPGDDSGLHAALVPAPSQLRPLYIFQTKMSMMTRLAQTAEGAGTLLRCGVMQKLAGCSALDLRPERDSQHSPMNEAGEDGFVPDPLARYRLLLSAALRLCLALLTALGMENKEAAAQVMLFVISHGDVFNVILRSRSPSLDLAAMRELSLTTAVIARANCQDDLAAEFLDTITAQVEFRSHRSRFHRQMLALLPRFCFSDKLNKQLKNLASQTAGEGKDSATDIALAYQEIASHITAFCRAVITESSPTYQYSRILFGPSLEEASARDLHNGEEVTTSVMLSMYKAPNLGVMVYQLRQCAAQFSAVFESHRQYQQKLAAIHELSSEDLKQLSEVSGMEKLSSQQRQAVARKRLQQMVTGKGKELQHLSYILENCLFIMWRHLEYYLLRCVPADQQPLAFQNIAHRQQQMRRLQDPGWTQQGGGDMEGVGPELEEAAQGVTRGDLDLLKKTAPTVISETLLKKVLDINQSYGKSHTHYSFTEAIVRRIRRLLRLHANS